MTPTFVHLHCHSHDSLLDGTATIPDLIDRARELDMSALALTDRGNLFGAMEFYRAATSGGIKPIIGYDADVAQGSRFERSEESHRLTLLVLNRTGYQNLLKLASLAWFEGFYYKPRIGKELLEKHHDGLICLSGGIGGELGRLALRREIDKAVDVAAWFRRIFGDRYYLELQNHGLEEEKTVRERLLDLSKRLDIPLVATNEVHYIKRSDWFAHDIQLCINTGRFRQDKNRIRMGGDQYYFRSGDEMFVALPEHEDAIRRTQEIADRIDFDPEFGRRHWPVAISPDDGNPDERLRELCLEGLKRRYADNPIRFRSEKLSNEVLERLNSELSIIRKLDVAAYFLLVADIVRFADEHGIYRTARGSGVGSLLCYALNVSHVCPLEFDLIFERFLDENRTDPPDIDIDFDLERREEIVDYVKTKFGKDHIAHLAAFDTFSAKLAIKDVGRVLDLPIPFVEGITDQVPDYPKIKIETALIKSDELRYRYENKPRVRKLLDLAMQLEGIHRQAGVHACGYVIADQALVEYVPLKTDRAGAAVTQWQRPDVERAGLLVMDFLGLRNLTVLARTVRLIKETRGETLDPYKFPLDDSNTFDLLRRGETKGIFQMECEGIREFMRRVELDAFREIPAILALYRPGPLEGGMVDRYIDVKHGRKQAEYLHPVMKEVLAETYGVIVYQEQVMRILNKLGKIPLGDTFEVIKAVSKKRGDIVEKSRKRFAEGAVENGVSESSANGIFDLIVKFAGYGFNKSHSTAYAQIAYMSAYLKANYTLEFMASLLCDDIPKRNFALKDSTVEHVEDCRRMEIEMVLPEINRSNELFTMDEARRRFSGSHEE